VVRVTQVAVILSKFGHIHVHMSVSKFAISIGKAIGWMAKICPIKVVVKVLAIHSTVKNLPLMRAQKFSHTQACPYRMAKMFQLLPKLVKKTLK
jgi:hypothetical protein